MTSITLRNIQKTFSKDTQVIKDVNLDIASGEFCVILGPSGCGKSTLLRMVAGIEDITAGELRIGSIRMNEVPAARRQVAMVFQNYALYPHMSVYDNMAFGLRQAKVDKNEIDKRVREAAQILKMESLLDRMPRALSGGQRQRVAIGRAIVRSPNVFLFDEPLSNLDAALRVHMRSEISRLHRKFNHSSAIYVTHDQTEAMAMADKIVLLRAGDDLKKYGSIAQVGTPMDLYHRPGNRFVAEFLGSPRMNFLPATVVECSESDLKLRLTGGELLKFPFHDHGLNFGAKVTLGIRPEHMYPLSADAPDCRLSRPVRQVERFGEYSYVYMNLENSETLIAKVPGDCYFSVDEVMCLGFHPENCHIFDEHGIALPYTGRLQEKGILLNN
ncbi:MAG: sn-glycerol-3-phosphate ABC transporter ATP-binding protein UgpC [Fibrobacter sp.]|nr:sn-glycerol-3-phosphate ABC transporter ATP-binding protein UgpC [Fibrobacter sp.]